MTAMSGDRHFFIKNDDFFQMADEGVFPKKNANIPIISMDDGFFHIIVSSGRAIKVARWLDAKYGVIKDGVRVIHWPAPPKH